MCTYTAEPGTASADGLKILESWPDPAAPPARPHARRGELAHHEDLFGGSE
jgi:hypothetical protein